MSHTRGSSRPEAGLTMAELRALAQPPAVMGRRNSEHWAGALYLRKMSIYVTRVLLPTGVTPNGVTWLMTLTGLGAAGVLAWPAWWSVLICHLLLELQILLDCSDGEIARVRSMTSPAGVYIDRIGHYLTEGALPLGVGVHVDGGLTSLGGWTTLGAVTSIVVLWNKCFGDLIHVARGYAKLPLLSEDAAIAAPRGGLLRRIRSALTVFPFFRAFVAFEFSLLTLAFAVIDEIVGGHDWLRGWTIAMAPLACVLAGGHLLAILASKRLTH